MDNTAGLKLLSRQRTAIASISISILLLLCGTIVSCAIPSTANDRIGVVVSILPQAEFMENIGGDKVSVTVMVPAKANPHTYEPKPGQMKALAQAQLYAKVGSGIEFELAWMDKLASTNQKMLVIDCSKGIQLIEGTEEDNHENKSSAHSIIDPHIWMSPSNARIMVQNLYAGLNQLDPGNNSYYQQNRDAYLQKLVQLDADIREKLAKVKNRKFLVYHPSFGYFAHEYNLNQIAIEEGGKEPTPAGIVRVIQQAKENNIKVVFASPQFNPQSARVIADAIGGKVVLIDHLSKEYVANMRSILSQMVPVME